MNKKILSKLFLIFVILFTSCSNITQVENGNEIACSFGREVGNSFLKNESIPATETVKVCLELQEDNLKKDVCVQYMPLKSVTSSVFKFNKLKKSANYKIIVNIYCRGKLAYKGESQTINLRKKNVQVEIKVQSCFSGLLLTDEIVELPLGTDGSAGPSGKYVYFGDWPQSLKAENVHLDLSTTVQINKWDCYKGDDGYYYVKRQFDIYAGAIKTEKFLDNKTLVERNKDYYFKLEPIKWRVLKENYIDEKGNEGGVLLVVERIIDGSKFQDFSANFKVQYPSHYDYFYGDDYSMSRIRARLLGENYTTNQDSNGYLEKTCNTFYNKGFYQMAFTDLGRNKILVKENKELGKKLFLISRKNIDKAEGFNDVSEKEKKRVKLVTDYSLLSGIATDKEGKCKWWLKDKVSTGSGVYFVDENGIANNSTTSTQIVYGFVPAVVVKN